MRFLVLLICFLCTFANSDNRFQLFLHVLIEPAGDNSIEIVVCQLKIIM